MLPAIIACLVLASGCGSTQEHRIRQNRAAYDALPPPRREAVREGRVEPGFSALEVYLALGPPNRSRVFRPRPEPPPGTVWRYVGHVRHGRFRTTADAIILQGGEVRYLYVTFGDNGVASMEIRDY